MCGGEVSVPHGVCQEPSNVAADGQSCPVGFRCVGCDHFPTDVSYLPGLQAFLAPCCAAGSQEELQCRVSRLEQANTELLARLEERDAELEAARAANRELTRALNQKGAGGR